MLVLDHSHDSHDSHDCLSGLNMGKGAGEGGRKGKEIKNGRKFGVRGMTQVHQVQHDSVERRSGRGRWPTRARQGKAREEGRHSNMVALVGKVVSTVAQ